MWKPLRIKIQEIRFFADQLRAHTQHPHLFLFYLSAFLSSARSVTFHIQKQFARAGKQEYEQLRSVILSDEVATFFVNLRNASEKEGYPPLSLELLQARKETETGGLQWIQNAKVYLFREEDDDAGFDFLQKILRVDWDLTSLTGPPIQLQYVWRFLDYPGESSNVVLACEHFAERLFEFVAAFRAQWEAVYDPESHEKKFRRAFFLDD